MKRGRKGFTLIELMMVVAIILILIAIAVPNLLHSRMSANEASALALLNALNTAFFDYWTNYDGYPPSLADMASDKSLETINSILCSGTHSGYKFTYSGGPRGPRGYAMSYTITAVPVVPGVTGRRSFSVDQSGAIHAADSTPFGESLGVDPIRRMGLRGLVPTGFSKAETANLDWRSVRTSIRSFAYSTGRYATQAAVEIATHN